MSKYYGLPARGRLRRKKEVQAVYARGRVYTDRDSVLYVFRRSPSDICRIAVAAGKKLGGAVTRNRLKRLMRESYRTCHNKLQPGWDLLWIARRSLLQARLEDFSAAFVRLVKRAGIYDNTG